MGSLYQERLSRWLDSSCTDNDNSQSQEGFSCAELSAQPSSPNSGIKVSLTWPFYMNTEVDSYRTDAHNLTNTETTYYINFE